MKETSHRGEEGSKEDAGFRNWCSFRFRGQNRWVVLGEFEFRIGEKSSTLA